MSYETLIYAKAENIATVTLNRPEKRNAWTTQMSEDVVDVFKVMEDDPEVLVTVLTGTGTQAFSAGADLGNPKTHRVNSAGEHLATVSPRGFAVFNAVADYPKPVVVAINGFAVGIGCLITLCGDILLASENAELGLPQVPLGIIPAYGGAVRLARYVGRGKAMEMVLLGERINAAEAYRVGLVNKVVPLPELMPLGIQLRQTLGGITATSSEDGERVAQQRVRYRLAQGRGTDRYLSLHVARTDRRQPRSPPRLAGETQAGV